LFTGNARRDTLGIGTPPSDHQIVLRRIIHIDMDALYASVEQRDDPSLHSLSQLAAAGNSGAVAAASYEARRFGVRSAMASITAKRRCPELIFVRPHFDVHRAVSWQVHDIFDSLYPDYPAAVTSLLQGWPFLDRVIASYRSTVHLRPTGEHEDP
jgi:hypothetical protein